MILQLKRTKKGTPVVYGPLSVMKAGMVVKVEDGAKTYEVQVQSLGKPFNVQGATMVYGYITGGHSTTHSIGESLAQMGLLREVP